MQKGRKERRKRRKEGRKEGRKVVSVLMKLNGTLELDSTTVASV